MLAQSTNIFTLDNIQLYVYIVTNDNFEIIIFMPRPKVSDERREEILKAFEACVVRKGIVETTLADVANEACLPRPLVRYFIGNRDDMVTCLIERIFARGESRLNMILSQKASFTPAQLTDLLFDQMFADDTTNIVIMELWHLSIRNEALRLRLASIYRRIVLEVSTRIKGDATSKDAKRTFDVALAAVSLAFGTSFFEYMGLTANDSHRIRSHVETVMAGVDAQTHIHSNTKRRK